MGKGIRVTTMKAIVMSDAHIAREQNGKSYWCRTAVHGYDFWKRYLDVFDEVTVVARVQELESIDETVYTKADGEGVHFVELPFIRGTKGYITNYFKLKKIMRTIIKDEECGIFRLPSLPTFMLLDEYKKLKRPYAIEVIVDPEDAYKTNAVAQKLLTWKLKKECLQANGVSYVTKDFLERKYPSKSLLEGESKEYFDSYYSSIKLDESFFGSARQYDNLMDREIRLIHVASAINSDIKGHSTLLKVVKSLVDSGVNVSLRCIGDGDRRSYYENMAQELGIENHVRFLGLFSNKNDLRNELINSDMMVFPSRAEGLPRVLIEAMAVGLPCLSTPVNGIPELLGGEYLFDPDDVTGFVEIILRLINSPNELEKMSQENIQKAMEYRDIVLQTRRDEFYTKLVVLVK